MLFSGPLARVEGSPCLERATYLRVRPLNDLSDVCRLTSADLSGFSATGSWDDRGTVGWCNHAARGLMCGSSDVLTDPG
jgi:hypothetical protein